jgi:hypothetical protein
MNNVELTTLSSKTIGGDTKILAFDTDGIGTTTARDILKMRSVAENVFPVLRSSDAAGKFGTEYNEQLVQALAGLAPFPSVYAARDACYLWKQTNPYKRAAIILLSGHYESICHKSKPLAGADRVFSDNVNGVYGLESRAAILPAKFYHSTVLTDEDLDLDFFGTAEVNPNASSLFVNGVDFICEDGVSLTFQGVCAWYNNSTASNILKMDSVKYIDSSVVFFSNTHTDYSARRMEIAGGYTHSFWSQYGAVCIEKIVYTQSSFDGWGWTGFGYFATMTSIVNPKRGRFSLVVKETETPVPMACYGLNAMRVVNTDVNVKWEMSGKAYLYFPICLGNWNSTRRGYVLKDNSIVIETNCKSSRPNFANNLHYQNIYLFGFPAQAFHSGNRVKIVADTDTENGILLTQDCHYDIGGQIMLQKHLYGGKESIPYMTVNGGVTIEGSVKVGVRVEGEEDAIGFNGKLIVLPTASCNANHKGGLPIVK